jgi:hypothetical protein
MINQKTINRIIGLKLDPLSFYAVIAVQERRTENAKYLEQYIGKYGLPSYSSLVDAGIFKKLDDRPACFDNVIFEPGYSSSKSDMFDMAEELWDKYPAAFPLGDGGMFIARKGPDKHEVLKLYLERINSNPEKHQFVMKQLETYSKMVFDRKINGHRIHDWISNEMWDIVASLEAASRGEFKTDI